MQTFLAVKCTVYQQAKMPTPAKAPLMSIPVLGKMLAIDVPLPLMIINICRAKLFHKMGCSIPNARSNDKMYH